MAAAPSSSSARVFSSGAVSSSSSSSLLIRRAKRCAFRMFMVDLLIRLRPWMVVTTLFSRYSRPITGIMASARASRPIHVSRQESDVWLTELPSLVQPHTSSYADVGHRKLSRGAGTGGVSVHPGCRWTRKEKPPAANADPAEELLRSLSILGLAGCPDRRGDVKSLTPGPAGEPSSEVDGLTDTPGSVLPCRYQRGSSGHPSTDAVADALQRPTRTLGRAALKRALSGLAPGGVYLAFPVTREAGGLLHHRFTLTCFVPLSNIGATQAVCSLWHWPAGYPEWALPTTLLCGARTFLEPLA